MTREYQTLIGDGRECVTVHYEIIGEPDDFDIEVMAIYFAGGDVIGCLSIMQIVEVEMEIIKHHKHLMSGLQDV